MADALTPTRGIKRFWMHSPSVRFPQFNFRERALGWIERHCMAPACFGGNSKSPIIVRLTDYHIIDHHIVTSF